MTKAKKLAKEICVRVLTGKSKNFAKRANWLVKVLERKN